MSSVMTLVRYWVAGEDSRPGRQDYWNHTYLPGKSRQVRFLLETSKVVFVIALAANVAAGLSRIL